MAKIDGKTYPFIEENIEQLKKLFPEAVTENKIDFAKLRLLLGDEVETEEERYEFTWKGKTEAIRLAQKQTTGTLRPKKGDSVDWDRTENLYIEGDNLEVLRVLQTSYRNKIKMIYIDPPYNTGNDFIYRDDFRDNISNYKEKMQESYKSNAETSGRFHTDWLNMMYPRIKLAKNLLTEDGVMFISIDDNEQPNLRKICDEIFGEECFVTTLHVEMSATQGMKVKAAQKGNIVKNTEYILVYSKNGRKDIAETILYDYREKYDTHYSKILTEDGEIENLVPYMFKKEPAIEKEIEALSKQLNKRLNLQDMYDYSILFRKFIDDYKGRIFRFDKVTGFTSEDVLEGEIREVTRDGKTYLLCNKQGRIEQLLLLKDSFGYCDDFNQSYGLRKIRGDWWKEFYKDMGNVSKEGDMKFENGKKPVRLIKQLIKMTTKPNDYVLDFFSGSATTAHAVMELNMEEETKRKFILVQLPEELDEKDSKQKDAVQLLKKLGRPLNICEIGKERIRRARKQLLKNFGEASEGKADLGFKVFFLDSTNFHHWDEETENVERDLWQQLEIVKNNRTSDDVLFEILLKTGIELTVPIGEKEMDGKRIYSVGQDIVICLERDLTLDFMEKLLHHYPDRKRFIFYDEGFANDTVRINGEQLFHRHGAKQLLVI